MNLVILCGRLVRDPELKFGKSGTAYSRFSIAVDRAFATGGNKDSQTADFINCVSFGKTAETIGEYFRKGNKILLRGRLEMSQYEQEGKKITTYNVMVDSFEFVETKNSTSSYSDKSTTKPLNNEVLEPEFEEEHSNESLDDEFPF